MNRPTILIAAVALLAANVGHAHAQFPVTSQVRVSVADLNLQSPAGAEAMLKRLRWAATRACGERPPIVPLQPGVVRQFEACRSQALGRAVADLDAPLVTSRYAIQEQKAFRLATN